MFKGISIIALGLLLISSVASITHAADDRALRRQLEEMRSETRVALVIGNADYASSPLKNPVNDARLMAKTLKALGFDVIELTNATQKQMKMAVDQFGQKIRNGGVALFYYAGHGMQVGGRNYLIPVGANITGEAEVEYESVDSGRILAKMEMAGTRVNIVMLDACRNNPFARSFRSGSTGLATVDAPRGSFIAYATAPGSVAADGDGSNGLFTEEFVQALSVEGQSIENVFKQVRSGVMAQTGKKQIPWTSSSMTGDFYFKMPSGTATVTPSTPSQIDLSAPTGGAGVELGDLQQRAAQVTANKKAWAKKLAEMQATYAQIQQFEQSEALSADKKIAWERFAAAFAEDNPYSSDDDALRAKAGQRISHWETQAEQVAATQRPMARNSSNSSNYNIWSVNGHKYTVVHSPQTSWKLARNAAQSLGPGWDLATITSSEEQQYIVNLIGPASGELIEYYIGGTYASGKWQWVTNERFTFTYWGNGEPNGYSSEPYIALDGRMNRPNWGWNDYNGSGASFIKGFIAEQHH